MSFKADYIKQKIREEGDTTFKVLNGFICEVARHPESLHLCGYIHLPPEHPWYGKDYDYVDADVHGGVTFSDLGPLNLWKVGFDTAHVGDIIPSMLFIGDLMIADDTYKDMDYMLGELENLSRQAKELLPDYEVEDSDALIARILLENRVLLTDGS